MSGAQTAYAWMRCGYRTLDDLRAVESSLTRNQRIGLKYYDEFLDRMPRAEAMEIEATVNLPLLGWRHGVVVSGVRRMNEVNALRARLLPGWVTLFGRVYHLGL